MDKTFYISKLISTDIRSRANANIIRSAIDGVEGSIVLDFTDVVFVSRSFTDELYNVMKEHGNIKIKNESDFVKTMLDAVTKGRESRRVHVRESSEIKEFNDIKSLESFLATI